eukprot:427138-Hanusia_phi.AAC.1
MIYKIEGKLEKISTHCAQEQPGGIFVSTSLLVLVLLVILLTRCSERSRPATARGWRRGGRECPPRSPLSSPISCPARSDTFSPPPLPHLAASILPPITARAVHAAWPKMPGSVSRRGERGREEEGISNLRSRGVGDGGGTAGEGCRRQEVGRERGYGRTRRTKNRLRKRRRSRSRRRQTRRK